MEVTQRQSYRGQHEKPAGCRRLHRLMLMLESSRALSPEFVRKPVRIIHRSRGISARPEPSMVASITMLE